MCKPIVNMSRLMKTCFLIILMSGCAATSANFGPEAEANKTQERTFEASYDEVYRTLIQTASLEEWEIKISDKDAGLIQGTTKQIMTRWSDDVSITLNSEEGSVVVVVRSKLGQKPNRTYIAGFLDKVAAELE